MPDSADFIHGIIGVCTEAGELAEALIKYIETGEAPDITNIREEIGDELWYLSRLVKYTNTTFDAEMRRNIAKLRQRHGDGGFNAESDVNRDLTAERKVLEDESDKGT